MASKFPVELLEKIKAGVDLVEIASEHVVLRKSGSNHTGLCPFHGERTPSFSVSQPKQLYHCYGCKVGGDIVTFVKEIHGISFQEAVEDLADRAGVKIPAKIFKGATPKAREGQDLAYKLNRFAAAFFRKKLGKKAKDYLKSRHITDSLARDFYIGMAPDSWDGLAKFLKQQKAPLELAKTLGLVMPSKKHKGEYFDLFRNRVVFPILDLKGKVAGFGGRSLNDDTPKYLNSPESFLFQKSKLAFGLYQAKKHARETNELVLVEGYFDVMALHAAGFPNAVATCGTSLSSDHLTIFSRFADRIILLFDGDQAGQDAMDKAMELGLSKGQVLYGATLPDGLDPDELVFGKKGGSQKMKSLLRGAKPLIDVRIDEAIERSLESTEARSESLKQIGKWLTKFNDPVGRQVRVDYVREKMNVPFELLKQVIPSLARVRNTPARPPRPRQTQSQARAARGVLSEPESVLLGTFAYLFARAKGDGNVLIAAFEEALGGNLGDDTGRKLPPKSAVSDLFEHSLARKLVDWMARQQSQEGEKEPAVNPFSAVMERISDPQVLSTITEAALRESPPFPASQVQSALTYLIQKTWARFSQSLRAALNRAEAKNDNELQAQLMKDYLDVQRKMKELNNLYGKI